MHSIETQEVLVTFQGPHDYISPSWYSSPGVPTWNYQTVHVYGSCKMITDDIQLKQIVNALTMKYESLLEQLWEPNYNDVLLKSIVGLEISINEIQAKFKLSQNRSGQDREQVIEKLKDNGSVPLSQVMNKG